LRRSDLRGHPGRCGREARPVGRSSEAGPGPAQPAALLKLAALFHDSGKPAARRSSRPAAVSFSRSRKGSAAVAEGVADRLKLSARDRAYFENLVGNHMHAIDLSQPQVKLKTLLRWFAGLGRHGAADRLEHGRHPGDPRPGSSSADANATRAGRARPSPSTTPPFGAARLEALLIRRPGLLAMGVPPGPVLGRVLQAVREAQDEKSITTAKRPLGWQKACSPNRKPLASPAAKR